MTNLILGTNSLRLCNMLGAAQYTTAWFYNGSIRFEPKGVSPRVFDGIDDALTYCTANLHINYRVPGQFLTFADGHRRNWVIYVYCTTDLDDASYSNAYNWKRFIDEPLPKPFDSIKEVLDGREALLEQLVSDETYNEVMEMVEE